MKPNIDLPKCILEKAKFETNHAQSEEKYSSTYGKPTKVDKSHSSFRQTNTEQ